MKLGVVGTGTIATEVLPLLRGWGWEPVAICGTPRSKGTVDRLCAEHQVSGSYVDYPTMLKEADVDTIYIGFTEKQEKQAGRRRKGKRAQASGPDEHWRSWQG